MSSFRRLMRQTAVYWGTPTHDGTGGLTFADPVEIKCRWESKFDLIKTAEGQEVRTTAVIFHPPDLTLEENGFLYLGCLDDLSAAQEADPQTVTGARPIIGVELTPSLRNVLKHKRVWV